MKLTSFPCVYVHSNFQSRVCFLHQCCSSIKIESTTFIGLTKAAFSSKLQQSPSHLTSQWRWYCRCRYTRNMYIGHLISSSVIYTICAVCCIKKLKPVWPTFSSHTDVETDTHTYICKYKNALMNMLMHTDIEWNLHKIRQITNDPAGNKCMNSLSVAHSPSVTQKQALHSICPFRCHLFTWIILKTFVYLGTSTDHAPLTTIFIACASLPHLSLDGAL